MEVVAANEENVQRFFDVLSEVATIYLSNNEVEPADCFMAAHNFHVWLLMSVEKSLDLDHNGSLLMRKMAIDTFVQSLERHK